MTHRALEPPEPRRPAAAAPRDAAMIVRAGGAAVLMAVILSMPQLAQAREISATHGRHHGGPTAHAAVVDGSAAAPGTWPWLAFVANTQQSTACSGTVIAPMVVLTAAHCAENLATGTAYPASAFRVVTGTVDWSSATAAEVTDVTAVEVDPNFSPTTLDNDVAVLILAAPASAPAITLASATDASLLDAGTAVSVAGWGETYGGETSPPTTLYWGASVVQAQGFCVNEEYIDGVPFDPANALCALDAPSLAIATCHGDSGGPLVAVDSSGDPVEIGITSRGDPLCNPDFPSVFTQAGAIAPWADSVIAANPPPVAAPAPAAAAAAAATAATSARTPLRRPSAGTYTARTSRAGDSVSVSVGVRAGAESRLRLHFVLACPERTVHSFTLALRPLVSASANWHFTKRGGAGHGSSYTVSGALAGANTIAGTFEVSKRASRCSTGRVSWRAVAAGASDGKRALRSPVGLTGLDIRLSQVNNRDAMSLPSAEAQSTTEDGHDSLQLSRTTRRHPARQG